MLPFRAYLSGISGVALHQQTTNQLNPSGVSSTTIASADVCLTFEPSLEFVQKVVQWLTDFCHLTLKDAEAVSRLELAVNELVENVVKYGMQPDVRVSIDLQKRGELTVLRLSTSNAAEPERLARATKLLTELRAADDPEAYYDQLIIETAPLPGVSGIGLARIRAEADLDVDFRVKGDRLEITVEAVIDENGKMRRC